MIKLQHLAIVFIIIIVPISIVISQYTQTQIDTIYVQSQYNKKLQDACYDAIKAFQINTINNKYSSLNDSKLRDIEASVTTFYNSLGSSMGASGYTKSSLESYIPAMVYTMYDGYYIYGRYYDNTNDTQGYGLKPFISYSCRYKDETKNYDIIVNYTLDNYIYIYGSMNETSGYNGSDPGGLNTYSTRSGYLIADYDNVINSANNNKYDLESYLKQIPLQVEYDGVTIGTEILTEQLVTIDDIDNAVEGLGEKKGIYEYVVYKNQKIYYDGTDYFTCANGRKTILNDNSREIVSENEITPIKYAKAFTWDGHLHSNSAVEYYYNAAQFSKWVNDNLGFVTAKNVIDKDGKRIKDYPEEEYRNYFSSNTGDEKIFEFNNDTNNPLKSASTFNEHRMNVIRKSIETNLKTAIASYNIGTSNNYEFVMPNLSETDWDKLLNNVSLSVFMQGLPMKSKYYNSYCVVTNDKNKEVATSDSIYIIEGVEPTVPSDSNNELNLTAHLPGCEELFKNVQDGKTIYAGYNTSCSGAYNTKDFMLQTVTLSEGVERYYYPHFAQKCYSCIVNASSKVYDTDDIISGKLRKYDVEQERFVEDVSNEYNSSETLIKIRTAYLTALGRERNDLYKLNGNIN